MVIRSGWRYLSLPLLACRSHADTLRVLHTTLPFHPIARPATMSRRALRSFCTNHPPSMSRRSDRDSSTHGASEQHGAGEGVPLTGDTLSSTSTAESSRAGEEDTEELLRAVRDPLVAERSWRDRAKTFAVEYGRVGICTHIVMSCMFFSGIYIGVSSGVDVTAIMEAVGLGGTNKIQDATANSAGSFIIAYALYKVVAPVRWPITFVVTPVVMRALRRRGYMLPKRGDPRSPPPPSSPPPASTP